jgi:H+/Cl- antiporter ClcA
MRKAGFLRRVALLGIFAAVYSRLVIGNRDLIREDQAPWLYWVLFGAIAWGVGAMLADRLGRP